ncbi:MAG: SPOR domain-containing protein [Bacteroidota bacterium]
MKSMLLFSTLLLATSFGTLQAQSGITVEEESTITSMMNKMVEINRYKETIEGWRIQILATTDRRKMEDARQKFQSRYPNISIDWTHTKPYYKLRAGAFTSKLEATRLLYQLKRDYPSAYPAKDTNIRPSELVGL